MRELLIVISAVALVLALEGARQLLVWMEERRREELRRRLHSMRDELGVSSSLLRQGKFAANPELDEMLRKVPLARRLEKLLEQADSRHTVAQIIGWTALAICGGIVASSLLRLGVLLGAVVVLIAAVTPVAALLVARGRRSNRLSEQLPDALDMMARSLRAGHALTSAFELVATEMPEPVAVEFGRAFEAQRLGIAAEQAIVQMADRAPGNRDVKIFAVSVLIQRETGGNLAEILGNISETIRARYRFYGKLRALTAEGRASAVVLAALPFVVLILIRMANPSYMAPLFAKPMGHAILAGAATLWLTGLAWLYRLTKVDI